MVSRRLWSCTVVMLLSVAFVAAQEQPPTIADSLKSLEAAVTAKDFATVYRQAHAIVEAAAVRAKAPVPPEAYAVGVAQYYLAAESLQAALARGLDAAQARAAIAALAGMGLSAPPPGVPDVKLIRTNGQELDIKEFVVPGKTTIVDLFSVYCGWCMKYMPKLEALAKSRPDIAIVEFDIDRPGSTRIDAGSPFGKQYGVRGIPQLKAFGPDGQLLAEGKDVEKMFGVPIKP